MAKNQSASMAQIRRIRAPPPCYPTLFSTMFLFFVEPCYFRLEGST
jgi:hypothetical protein